MGIEGLVVTVLNEEAIPILQHRIYDAGFENLDIIPLGADKVLVQSPEDEDVSVMFAEAPNFFGNFFSTPIKWNKQILVCERGTCVRRYGVPLNAWNINFLKLCVFDCGWFLKVDDSSLEKERFDYARVLLSTASLELIKIDATILVDGVLFELKIIEELGFSLGEDVRDGVNYGTAEVREDDTAREDVKALVHQLSEDWEEEGRGHDSVQRYRVILVEPSVIVGGGLAQLCEKTQKQSCENVSAEVKYGKAAASLPFGSPMPVVNLHSFGDAKLMHKVANNCEQVVNHFVQQADVHVEIQQRGDGVHVTKSRNTIFGDRKIAKHTSSCPPGRVHSVSSRPWSLKWINRQNNADKIVTNKTSSTDVSRGTKKKGCGILRHNAQSVKHIVTPHFY